MIDEIEFLKRLNGMRNVVPAGGPTAVINDVETIARAMSVAASKKEESAPKLTHDMLDELSKMVNDDEWKFGDLLTRDALQVWINHQWTLMPKHRYTVEVTIWRVDDRGENVERVHVTGPSEATTDLRGLDNNIDRASEIIQDWFYSVGETDSYSYLEDRTMRSDGSPV